MLLYSFSSTPSSAMRFPLRVSICCPPGLLLGFWLCFCKCWTCAGVCVTLNSRAAVWRTSHIATSSKWKSFRAKRCWLWRHLLKQGWRYQIRQWWEMVCRTLDTVTSTGVYNRIHKQGHVRLHQRPVKWPWSGCFPKRSHPFSACHWLLPERVSNTGIEIQMQCITIG